MRRWLAALPWILPVEAKFGSHRRACALDEQELVRKTQHKEFHQIMDSMHGPRCGGFFVEAGAMRGEKIYSIIAILMGSVVVATIFGKFSASLLQEGRVEDRWRLQPVLSSSSAAVCPASDGGYTLLALPEGADERLCFSDVRWSAGDTCLSQLQALTRAGLTSAVLETHSDVDELPDLRALWARLAGDPDSTSQCPHTRAMLAALATSAPAVLCG